MANNASHEIPPVNYPRSERPPYPGSGDEKEAGKENPKKDGGSSDKKIPETPWKPL